MKKAIFLATIALAATTAQAQTADSLAWHLAAGLRHLAYY